MANIEQEIWLVAGVRTPFVGVDGPFAHRIHWPCLVPVVQAMAQRTKEKIDFAVWGAVTVNLAYANLAREVWLDAKLDPHVPTFTTVMQCSTSMVGVFRGGRNGLRAGGLSLAMVGGVESMSRVQLGLGQSLSVWLRRLAGGRTSRRLEAFAKASPFRYPILCAGSEKPRHWTEHGQACEDMAKSWNISREAQDELALRSHQNAITAQDRGFFTDLILPVDGVTTDSFPRRDTSMEKLTKLKPAFDRTSGRGTLTAGQQFSADGRRGGDPGRHHGGPPALI